MRHRLGRIEVPGAGEAEERALRVTKAAYAQREPVARVSRGRRPGIALLAAAAVVGAAFTPPGRAVVDEMREVVGVERTQPALFRLPGPGLLLVNGDGGTWIVRPDGARRRLGRYREASWSPYGKFVVTTRSNELRALEPGGSVRWSIARPAPRAPRWNGTRTDTRIAYSDRSGLRIVEGDGTGDRLIARAATGPVAWRPGSVRELAHAWAGEVRLLDVETGQVRWSRNREIDEPVRSLLWSSDGKRLLVLSEHALRVYDGRGRLVGRDDPSDGTTDAGAVFLPGRHAVAVLRVHGAQSTVSLLDTGRTLFSGTGRFGQLAASPDGRWLLVTWPTADQWAFVRLDGPRRIRGVSSISTQFDSRGFPRVEGWCCPPQ